MFLKEKAKEEEEGKGGGGGGGGGPYPQNSPKCTTPRATPCWYLGTLITEKPGLPRSLQRQHHTFLGKWF